MRQLIDDGAVLGEAQRMLERCERDPRRERDAIGRCGDRAEQDGERREVTVGGLMVLRDPDRVEADLLRDAGKGERVRVLVGVRAAAARRHLSGEEPEADAYAHSALPPPVTPAE